MWTCKETLWLSDRIKVDENQEKCNLLLPFDNISTWKFCSWQRANRMSKQLAVFSLNLLLGHFWSPEMPKYAKVLFKLNQNIWIATTAIARPVHKIRALQWWCFTGLYAGFWQYYGMWSWTTPLPTDHHHDDGSIVTILQVKIVLFWELFSMFIVMVTHC